MWHSVLENFLTRAPDGWQVAQRHHVAHVTPSSPGVALNGLGWGSLLHSPNVPRQYSLLVCHHVWKIGKHQSMEEYGLLSEVDHSLDSVSISWLGNLVHGSNLEHGSYLPLV